MEVLCALFQGIKPAGMVGTTTTGRMRRTPKAIALCTRFAERTRAMLLVCMCAGMR